MAALRTFLLTHRGLAALLLACVLCLKAVAPAGFMVAPSWTTISVSICADASGVSQVREIAVPMKGDAGAAHGKAKADCPWSALALGALLPADSMLFAAALAFILATGFQPQRIPAPRPARGLRPPLRAPPVAA